MRTAANVEFYDQIMKFSDNEFVGGQSPIRRMTAQVFTPVAVVGHARAEVAVAQDREIYDAIGSGCAEEAEAKAKAKAMAHIQKTIGSVRKMVRDEGRPRPIEERGD